ncbi:hypothetical protein KIN20_031180 [Parelaphostrongylus tenuis]|uniref:Uncharacterized protein n=1 Tax=Parelaphostrongylus tenuis TaxID=148309 RepID=A0AAD5WGU5_PARTN|nr:hypothetical protein KIN20_031180 [Parelaphostrongylus tenuis]
MENRSFSQARDTSGTFGSQPCLPQRQTRDGHTQTEYSNIWLESEEQIERRLSRLLRDPACQQMVERMLIILQRLDMEMQNRYPSHVSSERF